MPSGEVVFEYLCAALEATKGTPVTPPTHYLPFQGVIKPTRTKARTKYSDGTLAEHTKSKTVTAGATWQGKGGADPNYAPLLFNLLVKANSTPTTPTNGIKTRLWTYAPTMTADDLKAATFYFGDPNVQIFQSSYCMAEEMKITADAAGNNPVEWDIKGFGRYPLLIAAPVLPARAGRHARCRQPCSVWIDTSSAIGTTEVTGRFISADVTIPTGVIEKRYAGGPTAGLNFTKHGRKGRSAKAKIVVELSDVSIGAGKEFLTWQADSVVKMRIRFNGSLIESVTPDYYNYIQLDIYGPLDAFDWGVVAGTNRTMAFEVTSEYSAYAAAAGYDWALSAQSEKTTL